MTVRWWLTDAQATELWLLQPRPLNWVNTWARQPGAALNNPVVGGDVVDIISNGHAQLLDHEKEELGSHPATPLLRSELTK